MAATPTATAPAIVSNNEPSADADEWGIKMTDELYTLVTEYLNKGLSWDAISNIICCLPTTSHKYLIYLFTQKLLSNEKGSPTAGILSNTNSGNRSQDTSIAAHVIGTKLPRQVKYKMVYLKKLCETTGTETSNSVLRNNWNVLNDEQLIQLIAQSKANGDPFVDWDVIGKQMSRDPETCEIRFNYLQTRIRVHKQQMLEINTEDVNTEVEKQLKDSGKVDWELVSKNTGIDVVQCLELCKYDEGKSSWVYDSDTFSWEQAQKMRVFILRYYPSVKAPVSFHAVSNFMWIKSDDCIQMNDLLLGKFEWTVDALNKLCELSTTGMSNKEIAKKFSPTLTEGRVALAIQFIKKKENPKSSLTAESRQLIQQIINDNAGTLTIIELNNIVRRNLPLCDREELDEYFNDTIHNHQHYQNKVNE
ncbi:hypothetical protein GGI12_001939, partial [Dipsacomyces acuminosporus]